MKKYINLLLISSLIIFISCDERFEELNTDPNRPGAAVFDPNLLLPTATFQHGDLLTGYSGPILFQSMWIQALASTSTGGANYYSNADKYVASPSTPNYIEGNWNVGFSLSSRLNQMETLAEQRGLTNLRSVAQIMKVSALSVVSDTYGDIPYSEALKAQEGISQPKYDSQSELYIQMLSELENALNSINLSGDQIRNDVMYRGDLAKWRRFGYSLMLKLGLRMTNANASAAQSWVQKAVAGGVFTSTDDDALVPSDEANGYSNSSANALNVPDDIYEVRWSKLMIDYLQANNDPRLRIVAEVPPAGLAANRNGLVVGNNNPAVQIGLPNGFDLRGGDFDISRHPNFPGSTGNAGDVAIIGSYSRPTAIYRNRNAPIFVLTYAEVQLLLADAAVRGFVSGSPSDFYRTGVLAAFTSMGKFGGATISNADATAYVNANPLNISAPNTALKMINEQIWATTSLFVNFLEAWNNWKRTGYPELTPVNFPGNFSSGQIPRRQPYPAGESSTNQESLRAAISRMGGDNWITRTWWDGGN
jgi:hypothetical protein